MEVTGRHINNQRAFRVQSNVNLRLSYLPTSPVNLPNSPTNLARSPVNLPNSPVNLPNSPVILPKSSTYLPRSPINLQKSPVNLQRSSANSPFFSNNSPRLPVNLPKSPSIILSPKPSRVPPHTSLGNLPTANLSSANTRCNVSPIQPMLRTRGNMIDLPRSQTEFERTLKLPQSPSAWRRHKNFKSIGLEVPSSGRDAANFERISRWLVEQPDVANGETTCLYDPSRRQSPLTTPDTIEVARITSPSLYRRRRYLQQSFTQTPENTFPRRRKATTPRPSVLSHLSPELYSNPLSPKTYRKTLSPETFRKPLNSTPLSNSNQGAPPPGMGQRHGKLRPLSYTDPRVTPNLYASLERLRRPVSLIDSPCDDHASLLGNMSLDTRRLFTRDLPDIALTAAKAIHRMELSHEDDHHHIRQSSAPVGTNLPSTEEVRRVKAYSWPKRPVLLTYDQLHCLKKLNKTEESGYNTEKSEDMREDRSRIPFHNKTNVRNEGDVRNETNFRDETNFRREINFGDGSNVRNETNIRIEEPLQNETSILRDVSKELDEEDTPPERPPLPSPLVLSLTTHRKQSPDLKHVSPSKTNFNQQKTCDSNQNGTFNAVENHTSLSVDKSKESDACPNELSLNKDLLEEDFPSRLSDHLENEQIFSADTETRFTEESDNLDVTEKDTLSEVDLEVFQTYNSTALTNLETISSPSKITPTCVDLETLSRNRSITSECEDLLNDVDGIDVDLNPNDTIEQIDFRSIVPSFTKTLGSTLDDDFLDSSTNAVFDDLDIPRDRTADVTNNAEKPVTSSQDALHTNSSMDVERLGIHSKRKKSSDSSKVVSLRDLIRLHEGEIARVSAGRKRDDTASNSTATENCNAKERCSLSSETSRRSMDDTKPALAAQNSSSSDVSCAPNKQPPIVRPKPRLVNVASFPSSNHSNIKTREMQYNILVSSNPVKAFSHVASQTNDSDRTATLLDQLESLREKYEREQNVLQRKLDEQRKVANAYQKLEDRYRKKVFELQRQARSCTCGATAKKNLQLPRNRNSLIDDSHDMSVQRVDDILHQLETWLNTHNNPMNNSTLDLHEECVNTAVRYDTSTTLEIIDKIDATCV